MSNAPPMSGAPRPALMLAIMEPPPGMEEEFNDWYDTEHLPQRRGLPGFLSASRWVALDGFPRSLAAYDLQSLAALSDPAYLAVAGGNSTPWSRRVLARTARAGRLRVEAELISRGGQFLPPHAVSRMLVARYAVSADHAAFAGQAAERYGSLPRLAQCRLFHSSAAAEIWALAEFWGPVHSASLAEFVGEVAGRGATFFNLYAPYNSATTAGGA
jgi:hypothetical protein